MGGGGAGGVFSFLSLNFFCFLLNGNSFQSLFLFISFRMGISRVANFRGENVQNKNKK